MNPKPANSNREFEETVVLSIKWDSKWDVVELIEVEISE